MIKIKSIYFWFTVYDILQTKLNASTHEKLSFGSSMYSTVVSEWRFGGVLGFGGKLINNDDRLYVDYYQEDYTPERDALVNSVNQTLEYMLASYRISLTLEGYNNG